MKTKLLSLLTMLVLAAVLLCSCVVANPDNEGGSNNLGGGSDENGNTGTPGDDESNDNSGDGEGNKNPDDNENDNNGGSSDETPGDEEEDDMSSYSPKAVVLSVKGGASGIVVLQHDDGYFETAVVMDNLLRKYDLVADVCMLSNKIWDTSTNAPKASAVKNWREILDTGRWKMVSHSHTHTWWGTATDNGVGGYSISDNTEKMIREIIGSQEMIRAAFPDQGVLTFAYPGFSTEKGKYTDGSEAELLKYIYSDEARELIDETYIAGRRVQAAYSVDDKSIDWTMSGCYHIGGNYTTSYVEKAIANGTLNVLYVHRMVEVPEDQLKTYAYPSNTMAAYYFESTCQKLARAVAEGTVWNTHYEDAVMYLREAQSATVSVEGDSSGLRVTLTDEMDDSIYNYPLTVRLNAADGWEAVKIVQGDRVSYSKVEYEAYPYYGGEYYVHAEIVPDGGVATVTLVSLSEVPEVKDEESKPSPVIPGETPAKVYDSFDAMAVGNFGAAKVIVCGLEMMHHIQDGAIASGMVVADGQNKYLKLSKSAITQSGGTQNWINIVRDKSKDQAGREVIFEARVCINIADNGNGLYLRIYNGRSADNNGGAYPFNYAIKKNGEKLTYNGMDLGVNNGEWFNLRLVMGTDSTFTLLTKNESGKAITVGDKSYADGEFVPRYSEVADGVGTVSCVTFMTSSKMLCDISLDDITFEQSEKPTAGGEDNPGEGTQNPRILTGFDFNEGYGNLTNTATTSKVELVTPTGRDNAALHIVKSTTGSTDRLFLEAGDKISDAKEIELSFSICVSSAKSALLLQIFLSDSSSTTPYNLTIRSSQSGISFGDLPSPSGLNTQSYAFGQWHKVVLKITINDDSLSATLTVNGEDVGTSTNRYSDGATVSRVGLYVQNAATVDMYIDDVVLLAK